MKLKKILIISGIIPAILFIAIAAFLTVKTIQVKKGKIASDREYQDAKYPKLSFNGSVERLSILPLIDYFSDSPQLKTEPGVSYLIKADDTVILLDVGYNMKNEHPSPLLQNMKTLGVRISDISILYFSHMHPDHVGGMKNQQAGTFSLSNGKSDLPAVKVYSPEKLLPSPWDTVSEINISKDPFIIKKGVASMGAIPRHLFLMGKIYEQSIAVNIKGKGIVLIIGCGHPSIERIAERAAMLFNEPIYAIIGGLHYPVHGGRGKIGPIDPQYIIAKDAPPWSGLNDGDLDAGLHAIKKINPAKIVLSPHDTSDAAIKKFKEAFPGKLSVVKVGKEIIL
ncbi:MAG: MBL fold metallo-hydrolase [Spirochaetes bacterium]|nr:MBL fold metallo-hydrolase [Spirochaetota bacterium]